MSAHRRFSPADKAKTGMFMSLRELAQVVGLTKEKMCEIAKRSGFPLFEGKVRFDSFNRWYEAQLPAVAEASLSPQLPVAPRPSDSADTPAGKSPRRGSRLAAELARKRLRGSSE